METKVVAKHHYGPAEEVRLTGAIKYVQESVNGNKLPCDVYFEVIFDRQCTSMFSFNKPVEVRKFINSDYLDVITTETIIYNCGDSYGN
jgi:hypothetical protein